MEGKREGEAGSMEKENESMGRVRGRREGLDRNW